MQINYQRVFSFSGTRDIVRETDACSTTEGAGGFDVLGLGSGWRVGRKLRVGGTVNGWFNGYSQRRLRAHVPPPRGAEPPSRTSTTTSTRA